MKTRKKNRAFTLVELLTVMLIIALLSALLLAASRFVRQKAATSRANGEIHGLETACENYKTDNGAYPDSTALTANGTQGPTDTLDPRQNFDPTQSLYTQASIDLYKFLSGDSSNTGVIPTGTAATTNYMADMPKSIYYRGPNQTVTTGPIEYLQDPFGYSYGYSTACNYQITSSTSSSTAPTKGYNPTFDLWSTAGSTSQSGTAQWIANWQ